MAKKKIQISYKCSQCGFTQPRWLGRCPECNSWNTMEECVYDPNSFSSTTPGNIASKVKPVLLSEINAMNDDRVSTGIKEFDRVLGGNGAVKRSAILLGGEPGIGKSTLLLQTAALCSKLNDATVLYVSGEESSSQIKSRAVRLGVDFNKIQILSAMRLEDITDALKAVNNIKK